MPIIVYDIIAAAILAYFAYRGYKTGFFLTLCNFLASIVALFGAVYIAVNFAQPIADILSPVLQMPIESFLETQLEAALTSDLSSLISDLKDTAFLGGFVEKMDLEAQATITVMALTIAEYVSLQIARILLFILGYFIIMMLWFTVSHALNLAFHLPILSGVNALAGLGIGIVQGLLIVSLIVWVLNFGILSSAELESTYLLSYFVDLNLGLVAEEVFTQVEASL